MRFKKILCIGLSLAMIASFTGCGNTAAGSESTAVKSDFSANAEKTEETAAGSSGANGVNTEGDDAGSSEANHVSTESTARGSSGVNGLNTEGDDAGSSEANHVSTESTARGSSGANGVNTEGDDAGSSGARDSGASSRDFAAASEIPAEDIYVTWEDSRIYPDLTLGRYKTVTTFGVKGFEDVPFLAVNDYLDVLLEGRGHITAENGNVTISVNNTNAVIDPDEDTVFFENPARFRSHGAVDGAVILNNEFNTVMPSLKNNAAQMRSDPITISLSDYHMPVIPYGDTVLMPFLALQNIFGNICWSENPLAYNGKDYYNVFQANMNLLYGDYNVSDESPYAKAIYSGPFSEKTETTRAYADYGYYSTCLQLDLTFGHKQELNITTFDEYFTEINIRKYLCSTDITAALTAEYILFNYLFDSGHDGMLSQQPVFSGSKVPDIAEADTIIDEIRKSEAGSRLFYEGDEIRDTGISLLAEAEIDAQITGMNEDDLAKTLNEKGLKTPENTSLQAWRYYLDSIRPRGYNRLRLDYVGDTAVIFFTSFEDDSADRDPSYYLASITEEDEPKDSFAFFYNCFNDIQRHEDIKNVVINVSDNDGGNAQGLISVLGFLSRDGEVRFTDMDIITGRFKEEYYHVDTNLDGVADDNDGFGGQYDFYILCSGASFSCANALPFFAQQDGLATIIGTEPGGGDCAISSFADAYGCCATHSGSMKMGRSDGSVFISSENAVEPDLNMMPETSDPAAVPWFDAEGIAEAIHNYSHD